MLISHNWITRSLRGQNSDWSVSPEELDNGFVRVGFETEGYEPLPLTRGPLVIGRVASIEELTGFKKPIRHCFVDVGDANGTGEPQSIVCGARNFQEGDLVVVSLPGTVLPGDFEISARETYGRMSAGMICSASELGFADKQNSGIIVLDPQAGKPGDDARPVVGLEDTVFDVNITPDRGYALSLRGLSREIASAFSLNYRDPAEVEPLAVDGELIDLDIAEDTRAVRFGLRKVTGIDPTVESPFWLQRELMLCGQRPVNAATDVTNYVMMLLGQPMHAFDAAKITGGLTVRLAKAGETLETLDHNVRDLDPGDVVICDDSGIQSLAGVMGGSTSEISSTTTDVYFEAACWDPMTVARTSRRHKLSSESSRRFERGVDPAIVEAALDTACRLLVDIAGGSIDPRRSLVGEVPAMPTIEMPAGMPGRIAGVTYTPETVTQRLAEIGCTVEENGDTLRVVPPTWRSDLSMPEDLVEEVLRLEGLDQIPSILPTPVGGRGLDPSQKRRRAITHALAYQGYAEIIPSPFIATDTFDVWGLSDDDPRRNVVTVQNPLESDHAVLGTTLLPSMLEAVARNVSRGTDDVQLFAVQQVAFKRADYTPMPSVASRPDSATIDEVRHSLPNQPLYVATVGTGHQEIAGPWGEGRTYTYADAIESARIVARAAGLSDMQVESAEMLPWHPGRCAALRIGEEIVGYAGELHPEILEALDLPARTCAMELNVRALSFIQAMPAPVLSAFPVVNQDIALVVDEDTPAEHVRECLSVAAGEFLEDVRLFDIYRSEQLGENKKSLAFALRFRAPDRTLTEEECSTYRLAAAEAAAKAFGAQMRG